MVRAKPTKADVSSITAHANHIVVNKWVTVAYAMLTEATTISPAYTTIGIAYATGSIA